MKHRLEECKVADAMIRAAVRFYQMALDTLENQASVDEILLGQIWLVLGETQRKAGENVRALDTLQRAATSARRLNSLEMRARSH